ncbi:pathogenicity island protein [Staphylococcus aureus]|nr:pathogenicity island protein [Staphylococcus aureus]
MIFSQNLFRRPRQLALSVEIGESNFSVLGPRQLALSVEIGNPISLCWGPD